MAHATISFDTFQYAKDLQKAGYTEIQIETQVKHAKKQANNINELIDNNFVTKKDLQEVKQELKQEIKETKQELTFKMEKMSYKIIITLGGILGGIIISSVAILGFLIKN
jgi:uncharacterized FlaG/YvyC family protein